MTQPRPKLIPALLATATLMGLGGVLGFIARPVLLPPATVANSDDDASRGHGHDHGTVTPDSHAGHGSSTIVELNESTVENMNVTTGKLEVRDYVQHIRIPAEVVEYRPQGRQAVAAPLAGRVSEVYVTQGEAIRPGQKLFELTVTDTSMSGAQLELMSVASEIQTRQQRLKRLKPLAERGVIAGKQVIDLEFELANLNRRRDSLQQELEIRGVPPGGSDGEDGLPSFNRSTTVYAPATNTFFSMPRDSGDSAGLSLSSKAQRDEDYAWFTVESITAGQGKSFERGQTLCELTWHGKLLIKGMAFESDMPLLEGTGQSGQTFAAEFGEASSLLRREALNLFSIDSHVDPESQTFPIYVALNNEIASRHQDDGGRWHVNWRFKPGQRAHLEIPARTWVQQVVAPKRAVVADGPETVVFKKMNHTHTSDDGTVIVEFEKIPVKVLHMDTRYAVLQKSLKLDTYENYALTKAHQLNLALKQAAAGGGEGHAHHGHSH